MPVAPFFLVRSAEHEGKGRDKQFLAAIVTDMLEKAPQVLRRADDLDGVLGRLGQVLDGNRVVRHWPPAIGIVEWI
jgi:hypothetical protein